MQLTPKRSLVILWFAVIGLACVTARIMAQPFPLYGEPHRPGFHYTPELNWTNEPNGLIYHDGRYHMFYQANPFNNQFGNQSWGHATSTNLIHWEQQPVAIPAEDGIFSYSGSAVHDVSNTSGLGTGGSGPLVAAYTGFHPETGRQDQRLAFSNDSGNTWTKFGGNPVLDIGSNEFRDPKVFWHEPTQSWKMVTVHGGQKFVSFYESNNLKNWSIRSTFTGAGQPPSIGGWEVPDMFELPVDGDEGNKKWVLSITPSNGSPAGGNGVMYFVGDFNGTSFSSDNPASTVLWTDYGRDFDGQQSWANMPDDRVVWTSIMQSYGEQVPTTPWRGQMAFPREVTLKSTPDGIRLHQQPIAEIAELRVPGGETMLSGLTVSPGFDPLDTLSLEHDMFELIATIDPQDASTFGFRVREGSGGETTNIGWIQGSQEMFMDRRASGNTSFASGAGGLHTAPMTTMSDGRVRFHLLVDRNSVEAFGNEGASVISNLIFPDPASRGISFFTTGGNATIDDLAIYPLDSIWTEKPAPQGSNVVSLWSMEATPHGSVAANLNPVSVDSRTAFGEGTRLGTVNQSYEPNAAVENLYLFNSGNPLPMTTSTDVAPAEMFAFGRDGGGSSYDAGALQGREGALFMPADLYGDDLAFTDAFSVELFFKTDGDQSNAGLMQLVNQGENSFRFGLIVNEGGNGNVRFAMNDGAGSIPIVDVASGKNYADGDWHYLLATYDPNEGPNGTMRITVANEDGSFETNESLISGAFQGLRASGDGNLLIGRERFAGANPRTFLGLIDEMQFTAGLVSGVNRLGRFVFNRLGDFDGDGSYGCSDIDALVAEIANGGSNLQFDLTGNGVIDAHDLEAWLVEAGAVELGSGAPFLPADANLDGTVDGQDFLAWNNHKFTLSPSWCSGDFNADGVVDGQDFIIWNSYKFTAADRTPAVPEPEVSLALGFAMALAWRHRGSSSMSPFRRRTTSPVRCSTLRRR